jgi:hypothetical protein
MPFALVFVGMILIVTGVRNTYKQLGTMVVADMTGSNAPQGRAGFIMFAAAIGMVGALGAIKEMRTFSHYFLALILISILLSNTGVMQKFIAALKSARPPTVTGAPSGLPGAPGAAPGVGALPGVPNVQVTFPRTGQSGSG